MKKPGLVTASIALSAVALIGMLYWYEWSARALTPSEVDAYMTTIEAQTQVPGARHDLAALRSFLDSDDGKPVYTVNLYRFHAVADYPEGAGFSGTGTDAYARFSKIMLGLMVPRASHPVFGSSWAHPESSRWDRIVIVRYRSRRDLADLFATDAFPEASLHKWASISGHDRMLVQGRQIPDAKPVVALIALLLGALTFGIGRLAQGRRAD